MAPVCNWAHLYSTFFKPAFHFFTCVWIPLPSVSFLPSFRLSPLLYPPFFLCHLSPPPPLFWKPLSLHYSSCLHCVVHEVKSSDIIFLCSSFSCCLCHLSVLIRFSTSHAHRSREGTSDTLLKYAPLVVSSRVMVRLPVIKSSSSEVTPCAVIANINS